jgi:hypothetical protein
MFKFSLRHAVPLMCAWLILSPVSLAAEEKTAAQPAPQPLAAPFDQYRNFREQPVADWREVNDRVHEAGGWRTYLREAHQDGNGAGQDRHQH